MEKKEMDRDVRHGAARQARGQAVTLPMELGAFMLRQVDEYFEKKGGGR